MRQILPALLLSLAATSVLCSAPAPIYRPKPVTRASLLGLWWTGWGDSHHGPGAIHLREDGSCEATYYDMPYVGSWALLPDGELVLHERPAWSDSPVQDAPCHLRWDADRRAWVGNYHTLTRIAR